MKLLPEKQAWTEAVGEEMPSRTYALDSQDGRVSGRMIDGEEALRQAVGKILQTQWMAHRIYDEQYGLETNGLLGADRAFAKSEAKRRIAEALLADERIYELKHFQFKNSEQPEALHVAFVLRSRFGEWNVSTQNDTRFSFHEQDA